MNTFKGLLLVVACLLVGACADTGVGSPQSLDGTFSFQLEWTDSADACAFETPASTEDLRSACDAFGGVASTNVTSTEVYVVECEYPDGLAYLVLDGATGRFEVNGPGSCWAEWSVSVVR